MKGEVLQELLKCKRDTKWASAAGKTALRLAQRGAVDVYLLQTFRLYWVQYPWSTAKQNATRQGVPTVTAAQLGFYCLKK